MRTRMIAMSIFVAVLVLVGCGATSPSATKTATPIPSTPTVTPIPTVTEADFTAACEHADNTRSFTPIYRLGDLFIRAGYIGIASRKLADDTAIKPLLLPDPNDQTALEARFPVQPMVNPVSGGGFSFTVCNASPTQSHEIEGATVRINQFTSYAGRLQTWDICDGYYTRSDPHGGVVGGGCGFGFQTDEIVQAAFAANAAAGAQATATWVSASDMPTDSSRTTPYGPLPATIPPGQSMVVFVQLTLPSATGTYAFAIAPKIDQALLPFTPIGTPALFAASLQKWTGEACKAAAMQSQIPAATTPPSNYICPEQ